MAPCASKLLDFQAGRSTLHLARLEVERRQVGVILFAGDRAAGKSFAASLLLQSLGLPPGIMRSGNTREHVTDGIDVAVADVAGPGRPYSLVVLDAEGCNDAQGPMRPEVNVLGLVAASVVAFVAPRKLQESHVQQLTHMVAEHRLRCPARVGTDPVLFLLINKGLAGQPVPRPEQLQQPTGDPTRDADRRTAFGFFSAVHVFRLPEQGAPDFQEAWASLRAALLAACQPLQVAGVDVRGPELAQLLQAGHQQLCSQGQLEAPRLLDAVVASHLDTMVQALLQRLMAQEPVPTSFDRELPERLEAAAQQVRGDFFRDVEHLPPHFGDLVAEARQRLDSRVDEWCAAQCALNTDLGQRPSRLGVEVDFQHLHTNVFADYVEGSSLLATHQTHTWLVTEAFQTTTRPVVSLECGGTVAGEWVCGGLITRERVESVRERTSMNFFGVLASAALGAVTGGVGALVSGSAVVPAALVGAASSGAASRQNRGAATVAYNSVVHRRAVELLATPRA